MSKGMPVTMLLGILLLGAGVATAQQGSASVSGTVTYLQRIALPPEAEITVRLVDVSRADAPAIELAKQTFTAGGKQVPFPFSLSYDPAAIDQRFTYAVQAEIRVDGQLRFINTQSYQVITRGNPTTIDVVVEPVGGGTPSAGGGTPSQLPSTGARGSGPLLALALAVASILAGSRLRRR